MSTPKTTAVDWLQEKIQSNLSEPMSPKFAELFEQAREMEWEQMEDAWGENIVGHAWHTFQDYYDKTYVKSE
jgi:hypothetical protein